MKIRTKHLRASFEAGFAAGLEGLKAMEIGAKQYDKEGPFFGPQNVRKSRRAKMGLRSTTTITTATTTTATTTTTTITTSSPLQAPPLQASLRFKPLHLEAPFKPPSSPFKPLQALQAASSPLQAPSAFAVPPSSSLRPLKLLEAP